MVQNNRRRNEKKILLSLVLIIFLVFSISLYSESKRIIEYILLEEILNDEFEYNSEMWPLDETDDHSLKMKNSKLIFEHKREFGSWYLWTPSLFMDDNYHGYRISASFKHLIGKNNSGYGLTWALEDENNYYTFNITDTGYYRIGKMQNGNWENIVKWTKSSMINTSGGVNKLEIFEADSVIEFKINDHIVKEFEGFEFLGDKAGFVIWKNQTIEIDNFKVSVFDDSSIGPLNTVYGSYKNYCKFIEIKDDSFVDDDLIAIWIQGKINYVRTEIETGHKEEYYTRIKSYPTIISGENLRDLDKEKTIKEWIPKFIARYNISNYNQESNNGLTKYKIESQKNVLSYDLDIYASPKRINVKVNNNDKIVSYPFDVVYGFQNTTYNNYSDEIEDLWYKSGNYGPNANYSNKHPKYGNNSKKDNTITYLWIGFGAGVVGFTALVIGLAGGF